MKNHITFATDRYPDLSPSELAAAIGRGDVPICPLHHLDASDTDRILQRILSDNGKIVGCGPKAMSVVKLGWSWTGKPAIVFARHSTESSEVAAGTLCDFCINAEDCDGSE